MVCPETLCVIINLIYSINHPARTNTNKTVNKNSQNKRRFFKTSRFLFIYCAIAFVAGAGAASLFWRAGNNRLIEQLSAQVRPLRQKNNPYTYINPLLGYEVPGDVKEFDEYKPLKNDIQKAAPIKSPQVQSYSVYFRDLTLGRWAGINEDAAYAPASMMKVAIMIAYFKEAEDGLSVLGQTLVYSSSTADQINGVPFETPSDLKVGQKYTVEQLIEAMIISSDNGAKNILLDNINQQDLDEIYSDLGLPNPDNSADYTISAKQYTVLLRVLYNATYLSRADSEKALQIMSRAEYSQGLVAGAPKGTMVAQKFGENVDASNPQAPEISLSNCGIVYHPTYPYILCVMTKGTDAESLQKTIAAISQTVWRDVSDYAATDNY